MAHGVFLPEYYEFDQYKTYYCFRAGWTEDKVPVPSVDPRTAKIFHASQNGLNSNKMAVVAANLFIAFVANKTAKMDRAIRKGNYANRDLYKIKNRHLKLALTYANLVEDPLFECWYSMDPDDRLRQKEFIYFFEYNHSQVSFHSGPIDTGWYRFPSRLGASGWDGQHHEYFPWDLKRFGIL